MVGTASMPSLNLDDKPGIFGESADGDAGDDVRCPERAIAQLPQKIKIKSSRHPEGRKKGPGPRLAGPGPWYVGFSEKELLPSAS